MGEFDTITKQVAQKGGLSSRSATEQPINRLGGMADEGEHEWQEDWDSDQEDDDGNDDEQEDWDDDEGQDWIDDGDEDNGGPEEDWDEPEHFRQLLTECG